MPEKDYLTDDPPINNQEYACVSFLTPELVKGCTKRFIKVRGVYGSKERAIDRCKQLSQIDSTYGVYTVEVGKWIAWSDKKNDDRDLNDLLNKLMELYLNERAESIKKYEKRKEDLVKENKKDHDIFSDLKSDDVKENNLHVEDVSKLDKGKYKEIKYLEEDPEINSQKFCCISYLMPEQLENNDLHSYGIRGFKIRQVFGNENDAIAKCKKFYELENHHDTYVGNIGHWLEWSHSPSVESNEYANEDLNKLMKAHEENEEKVKSYNKNNEIINESVNNLNDESNKFNFLNEIIDDEEDDEINLDSIDSELNNVNSELEEARKKYIEMLKEESNKK